MARAFFVIVIIASLAAISAWGKAMLTLRGLAFGLSLGVAGGLLQYLVQVQIHPGLNAGWAVVAVVVYGLAGVAGIIASLRSGLQPALTLARPGAARPWRALSEAIASGAALGLGNLGMIVLYRPALPLPAWTVVAQHRAPALTAVLVSVQAGLTEETIFRLLAVPVFLWALRDRLGGRKERVTVPVAVFLSAALLMAMHGGLPPGYWVFGTAGGVLLGILFLRHGVEAAVVAHFLTDLVSWGPVFMGWV